MEGDGFPAFPVDLDCSEACQAGQDSLADFGVLYLAGVYFFDCPGHQSVPSVSALICDYVTTSQIHGKRQDPQRPYGFRVCQDAYDGHSSAIQNLFVWLNVWCHGVKKWVLASVSAEQIQNVCDSDVSRLDDFGLSAFVFFT